MAIALALASLSACVTINVYFPAAAAEKAADRIIDEVWGKDPSRTGEPAKGQSGALEIEPRSWWVSMLDALIPAAHAQQADLDISTPAIGQITSSMEARHPALLEHWNSGAIGLTAGGLVAVRDPKSVPLAQRQVLNRLVADENRDRNALYREIARANGHPEWEQDIRQTFAVRWIQRGAAGWWYQDGSGWKRK